MLQLLILILVIVSLGVMIWSWKAFLIGLGCVIVLGILFATPCYFFAFIHEYLSSKSFKKAHQSGINTGSMIFEKTTSEISLKGLDFSGVNIDL